METGAWASSSPVAGLKTVSVPPDGSTQSPSMKFFMVPIVGRGHGGSPLARAVPAAEASTARLAGLDKAGRNLSPSNVFRCACARPCPSLPCSLAALLAAPGPGQARLRQAGRHRRPGRVRRHRQGQAARAASASAARRRSRPTGAGWPSSPRTTAARATPSCSKRLKQGSQRFVMRSKRIASLRFSPDSARIAAVANSRRIRVYDIANDKRRVAASGDIRGYSWAPDSKRVVYGEADGEDFQADSDLYRRARHGRRRPRPPDPQQGRGEPRLGPGRRSSSTASPSARTTPRRTTSSPSTRRPGTSGA